MPEVIVPMEIECCDEDHEVGYLKKFGMDADYGFSQFSATDSCCCCSHQYEFLCYDGIPIDLVPAYT